MVARKVNPFGHRADGRAAVAAMYSEFFGGMLHGTSTDIRVGNVRAVDDSHAFVDSEQIIHGHDGTVVLGGHLAAQLRRDGDTWRFVDARPCSFAPTPS